MAMVINKDSGGGKRRRSKRSAPMADLNMIPFIDVMLVLLVIFMVAAPMLSTGVPIDLPKTGAKELNIEKKPIAISIDEKGVIYLQEKPVSLDSLPNEIKSISQDGQDDRIYVRGSARVEYGKVGEVVAALQKAGFTKIGLVNAPQDIK